MPSGQNWVNFIYINLAFVFFYYRCSISNITGRGQSKLASIQM